MVKRRQTKTEQNLRDALTHELRERGIEGITVSSIARTAGINRGTFYAHYTDKFDFIESQVDTFTKELSDILLANGSETDPSAIVDPQQIIPYERIRDALVYVRDNYEFVAAITQDGTDLRLQTRVKEVLTQLIEQQVSRTDNLHLTFKGLPTDYGREFLLSNVVSALWLWIAKGCAESPEEIAHIIDTIKDVSPYELLE